MCKFFAAVYIVYAGVLCFVKPREGMQEVQRDEKERQERWGEIERLLDCNIRRLADIQSMMGSITSLQTNTTDSTSIGRLQGHPTVQDSSSTPVAASSGACGIQTFGGAHHKCAHSQPRPEAKSLPLEASDLTQSDSQHSTRCSLKLPKVSLQPMECSDIHQTVLRKLSAQESQAMGVKEKRSRLVVSRSMASFPTGASISTSLCFPTSNSVFKESVDDSKAILKGNRSRKTSTEKSAYRVHEEADFLGTKKVEVTRVSTNAPLPKVEFQLD